MFQLREINQMDREMCRNSRERAGTEGGLHAFNHTVIGVLGGLTRALAFYSTLSNQVGGSVTLEVWCFKGFHSATLLFVEIIAHVL